MNNTSKIVVYDVDTLRILKVSDFYDRSVHRLIKQRGVQWLNTSHPTTKALVSEINQVNKTNL